MDIKNILKASYQKPDEARETLKIAGYTQDPALSSQKAQVFLDKEKNPFIAYRGTELGRTKKTALADIGTDLMIGAGLGKYTKQYKDTVKLRKQVQEKYGKPITAIGHSKGGWQSEMSGADKVITYNKAVGLADIAKTIPKSQTDIRSKSDIVSLPSLTQKHKGIFKQKGFSLNPLKSHSLKFL